MATSKDFAKSVVQGSKETFDNCCSPCTEAGKTKEAKNFCVECESSFCEDCLLHHNKFPALRSHQILDRSGKEKGDQREAEVTLPTERCAIHHGKLIDMFCGDHAEVCCAACIAIKHRSCVNVDYLPDIAQGIRDSTEMKDTEGSLNDVLAKMKQQRETRKGNLASLDQKKDRLLNEVEKFKSELIQRIKELAEDAKQQICSTHEEYRKVVQSDVDTLDTVISTTSTFVQLFSSKNEAQLFVNVKAGKKSIKENETLLRDLSSGKNKNELKFTLNVGLKDQLNTLGTISVSAANEDIKEYKATLYGKFKVAPNHCQVTGVCAMEDGTYMISDFTNKQLKRLNGNFIGIEEITVEKKPYSLQITGQKEVAVFYSSGRVQLISFGNTMKLTTIFKAVETLAGIPYKTHNDEIFLIKNKQFFVCRKSGDTLRTYENKDISLCSEPKQTALSDDNNTIYLANYNKGLLALTREGRTRWTFQDPELKNACGVCVLPGNIILVSEISSNNILQVDQNGRKIGMLLGPSENLNKPFALAFDRGTSRLLVGCSSNEVHVYTLSKV